MLNSMAIIAQLPRTAEVLPFIFSTLDNIANLTTEAYKTSEIEKTKRKIIEARKKALVKFLDEYFKGLDKIVEKKFEEREEVIDTCLNSIEFLKERIKGSLKGELKEENLELLIPALIEVLKILAEVLEKPVLTEEEVEALKTEIFENFADNEELIELPEVLEI